MGSSNLTKALGIGTALIAGKQATRNLRLCPACHLPVAKNAHACPHCGCDVAQQDLANASRPHWSVRFAYKSLIAVGAIMFVIVLAMVGLLRLFS